MPFCFLKPLSRLSRFLHQFLGEVYVDIAVLVKRCHFSPGDAQGLVVP